VCACCVFNTHTRTPKSHSLATRVCAMRSLPRILTNYERRQVVCDHEVGAIMKWGIAGLLPPPNSSGSAKHSHLPRQRAMGHGIPTRGAGVSQFEERIPLKAQWLHSESSGWLITRFTRRIKLLLGCVVLVLACVRQLAN
jgi:hypothetical protein